MSIRWPASIKRAAGRRLTNAGVEGRIAELLNVHVDLAPEDMMHEPMKAEAEREGVFVF